MMCPYVCRKVMLSNPSFLIGRFEEREAFPNQFFAKLLNEMSKLDRKPILHQTITLRGIEWGPIYKKISFSRKLHKMLRTAYNSSLATSHHGTRLGS